MTLHRESTGIAVLDELGRPFEAARPRPRARKRWLAVALAVLALATTPAIAAVSGVFDGTKRVEDSLPEVAAVVDRADPTATGLALERLGFRVHWVLITDNLDPDGDRPTHTRSVSAPPAGTEILSILNEQGGNEATEATRTADRSTEVATPRLLLVPHGAELPHAEGRPVRPFDRPWGNGTASSPAFEQRTGDDRRFERFPFVRPRESLAQSPVVNRPAAHEEVEIACCSRRLNCAAHARLPSVSWNPAITLVGK